MALIKCSECGKEYSDKAKACPKCGNPTEGFVPQEKGEKNTKKKQQNNQAVSVVLSLLIFGGLFYFFYTKLDTLFSGDVDSSKYDTATVYNVGDKLTCPNWEITVDKVQVKKKGARIDSYSVINDPEWLGVTVTVKNTGSETKRFYTSNFGLINSNGEKISNDTFFYNVWGVEQFGSPELTSGGSKTGFVPFTNTNQDNSNLTLTVDCNTGLFDDKVIYKVNISK